MFLPLFWPIVIIAIKGMIGEVKQQLAYYTTMLVLSPVCSDRSRFTKDPWHVPYNQLHLLLSFQLYKKRNFRLSYSANDDIMLNNCCRH